MTTPKRDQMSAQDATGSTQEQVRADGMWRKFAEPRGWAVKWDGAALDGMPGRRDRVAPADKKTAG